MEIAIDFDGTCVTHEYPSVGQDIGAVPVLKKLVEKGHRLILHTMRSNPLDVSPEKDYPLSDAIKWFKDNGIHLWAVEKNPTQHEWTRSPKCYAQRYIDDAAVGCPLIYDKHSRPYVDWKGVEALLIKEGIL